MLNRVVSDGEFTQVSADHFWLDFNGTEDLTVVDTDNGTNHFWNNDHVSQVGLDNSWLFVGWSVELGLSELVDQVHWLVTQTSGESSSDSGVTELGEFFSWHFQ